MLEKQTEAINEFTRTRIEEAQQAFRKVEEQATDLVKRFNDEVGERIPGRERIETLLGRVRETRDDLENQLSDRITELVNTLGLPTVGQLDDLSRRLDRLSKKVSTLAAKKNGAKPRAAKGRSQAKA